MQRKTTFIPRKLYLQTAKRKMKKIKKYIPTLVLAVVFLLMAALSIAAVMYVKKNGMDYAIEELRSFVSSMGWAGIIFMFIIQTAQVVLAFIPGEPIEIAAGTLYGTVGGTILCLAGITAGTAIIFLLVKKLGRELSLRVIGAEKYRRLKFLEDPSKRDILLFLLMFIPGTPKDILTYFSPLSGISTARFLVIASVARIPSVITSTYVGGTLAKGDILWALTVFLIVGIISIGGIIIYNKIIDANNKEKNGQNNGK